MLTKNGNLTIIAGPCSIDRHNLNDIYRISEITVKNAQGKKQKAVFGTRVVGLKSRTALSKDGVGMGIDYEAFMKNTDLLLNGSPLKKMETLPSVIMAKKIIQDTGMLVATEVMCPLVQLPIFEKHIAKNKLLIWNPAVNQLGWPVLKMGHYAKRNHWYIGLKNGKWLSSSMEKTWLGLMNFANLKNSENLVFIQRGVDVKNKGDFRSLPVHESAIRVKQISRCKMFFDPSHSFGPKLRHKIVDGVIDAMKIKLDDNSFLYDGILIEVGHSQTDTDQHLTIKEFEELCHRLAEFRELNYENN